MSMIRSLTMQQQGSKGKQSEANVSETPTLSNIRGNSSAMNDLCKANATFGTLYTNSATRRIGLPNKESDRLPTMHSATAQIAGYNVTVRSNWPTEVWRLLVTERIARKDIELLSLGNPTANHRPSILTMSKRPRGRGWRHGARGQ